MAVRGIERVYWSPTANENEPIPPEIDIPDTFAVEWVIRKVASAFYSSYKIEDVSPGFVPYLNWGGIRGALWLPDPTRIAGKRIINGQTTYGLADLMWGFTYGDQIHEIQTPSNIHTLWRDWDGSLRRMIIRRVVWCARNYLGGSQIATPEFAQKNPKLHSVSWLVLPELGDWEMPIDHYIIHEAA